MNYDKLFEENFSYKLHLRDVEHLKEYLNQKQGWIYIACSKNNDLLKIGRTSKNPHQRAKTLSSSGVLHAYEIFFSLHMYNQFIVEKKVHQKLKKFRISKEFFSLKKEVAIEVIRQEYEYELNCLNKFIDTKIILDDINLLEHALI